LIGCETWSLTLREEQKLKLPEKRVMRRIYGCKKNEVTVGWGKLHNQEFRNLYSSPSIIIMIKLRRIRWVVHVACTEIRQMHIGFQCGSQKEKTSLGRRTYRCEDNIKIN
jgi:hypothetical protein